MSGLEAADQVDLLRQQTVLAKFGELALRSSDLDEILTEACRLVGEGLGTDLAKVMELRDAGSSLHVRAGVGWKPGVVGEVTIRVTDGTSEDYALKTGEPMVSPDIKTETRFSYPRFLTDNGVRAVANVVIIGGTGQPPFGILQIDSRTPRDFTDDTVMFLRSYANLIAAAVDRLRVIGKVQDGQERLRLALEASRMGSWELDLASGLATGTGRTLQILGYCEPPPAWNYGSFLDHVLPEDRGHVVGTFGTAVATGADWQLECRIRRAGDGEVRTIELRGTAAGKRGNMAATHLLAIMADITERRANEDALRQSHVELARSHDLLEARVIERTRELLEANTRLQTAAQERERVEEALRQSNKMEAVGQLTGGLAHDFNNLLAAISGSLEMVAIRAAQGRTGEFARYIDAALLSTSRAATLTHRLLAFSRRQTLDPRPTNVNELIGGMIELFRGTVGPEIQIQIKLLDDPWLPLCDPHQLESALLNLVINARDAMPQGGRLLIETANVVVPDRRATSEAVPAAWPGAPALVPVPATPLPGEYVALLVTDTGSGMTPEVLTRAFDPFFTTKPLGKGTGLGLSMIYGFIQQSGGHVHLASQPGQGTTVSIHLPRFSGVAPAPVAPAGPDEVRPAPAATAVVLVVEDEPHVRMIVVDVLAEKGYTVLEAVDGHAGLRVLESTSRIDLLVSDIGLPGGMSGRQLADAAQQGHPSLKVLFITGYANGVPLGSPLDPSLHVITKPFGMEAIAAKVQSILMD